MQATEINLNRPELDWLINRAITNSFIDTHFRCKKLGTTPQEPDFIASLTLKFTPQLFDILKYHFPKNKFSVTGVFCHQKPLVDFGIGTKPEIGDILFVYIYTDNKGYKRLNSLLLQAKMSSKLITSIAKSDKHQLELYKKWPDFVYHRAGKLNGISRSIQPKVANDGAQYLLIDNDPSINYFKFPREFAMGCAIPQETLHLDRNLSTEIVNFLKFKSGRTFEENPSSTNDEWTKLIWDLIEITKLKVSRRKNVGYLKFDRMVTQESDGLCFIQSENACLFSSIERDLKEEFDTEENMSFQDDEGGMSIVIIENTGAENLE